MGIVELILTAVGLSMDAFAAAICKGLNMKKINHKHAFIIALFFGGFQGLMPFIGWALGIAINPHQQQNVNGFAATFNENEWLVGLVVFGLLAFIGGKMVIEALKKDDDECDCCCDAFDVKDIFMLAVATSIDALAVGITFATLKMDLAQTGFAVLLIAAVTFGFSYGGVAIGNRFGARFKSKAEFAGGVILVLIGVKILLEHLGIISF